MHESNKVIEANNKNINNRRFSLIKSNNQERRMNIMPPKLKLLLNMYQKSTENLTNFNESKINLKDDSSFTFGVKQAKISIDNSKEIKEENFEFSDLKKTIIQQNNKPI